MSYETAFLVRMTSDMAAWITVTAEKHQMSVPAYVRLLIERDQQRQKTVTAGFNPFKKRKEKVNNGVISTAGISARQES